MFVVLHKLMHKRQLSYALMQQPGKMHCFMDLLARLIISMVTFRISMHQHGLLEAFPV
jgi:hypothetical protein